MLELQRIVLRPVQCHTQIVWQHSFCFGLAAVRAADVIVVVSGTDGALASVVAGLVETPVVSSTSAHGMLLYDGNDDLELHIS